MRAAQMLGMSLSVEFPSQETGGYGDKSSSLFPPSKGKMVEDKDVGRARHIRLVLKVTINKYIFILGVTSQK